MIDACLNGEYYCTYEAIWFLIGAFTALAVSYIVKTFLCTLEKGEKYE